MPVVALPDVTGAMVARLRSFSEIAALTGTRISAQYQQAWPMPTYAVLVQKSGGPGEDGDVPLQTARFDVHCFGPDLRTADLLWRTVHATLCPLLDRPRQFVLAGTRVYSVDQESGPIPLRPPSTAWPEVVCPYRVMYGSVPA